MAYPQKFEARKNGIPQGRSTLFLYNRNRNPVDMKQGKWIKHVEQEKNKKRESRAPTLGKGGKLLTLLWVGSSPLWELGKMQYSFVCYNFFGQIWNVLFSQGK